MTGVLELGYALITKFWMQSIIALACSLLAACGQPSMEGKATFNASPAESAANELTVLTVNYPLQYFTQRVGGNLVDARFPGPADTDPAYWLPDIDTVIAYQNVDLIVLNGAGYASWLKQVSLPIARQIDTSKAFVDGLLPAEENIAHTHGPTGEHVHDDFAFTVWLDLGLAGQQATAIRDALALRRPAETETLDENLAALLQDLETLDNDMRITFDRLKTRKIVYSHPVYQYLDRRYALAGASLHWEPGEPIPDDELGKLAGLSGALLLWEAEPLAETRAKLNELGVTSVVYDTCSNTPESADFMAVMRGNIQRLDDAFP